MKEKETSKYVKATSNKPLPPKEKIDTTEKKKNESAQYIYWPGKFGVLKDLAGAGGSGECAASECIDIKTALTIKCDVCGFSFYPTKNGHYIAREETKTGLCTTISNTEASLYDTFDCPLCGCQHIAAKRLRRYEEDAAGSYEEKKSKAKCLGGICEHEKEECCRDCDERTTCEEICNGDDNKGCDAECESREGADDD